MTKSPTKLLTPSLASGPLLTCPECGATIPVAEAVEKAVAARTSVAQEALVLQQRKEGKLRADAESRLQELEKRLLREHTEQLAEIEAERRNDHANFTKSINQLIGSRNEEIESLRQDLEAARADALKKYQEGQRAAANQAKAIQSQLEKAQAEQTRLRDALQTAESKTASTQFEVKTAFEKGRHEAWAASQKDLKGLQALLDEVRGQALNREKDLDQKLTRSIQEAEKRATAQAARTQKAVLEKALADERIRLVAEVSQENSQIQAVERQRYETQIQRLHQEIESLHRKVESGPSEASGDAAETVLERELREAFQADGDTILRTKKGQAGADFLITVPKAGDKKLLVESKWTQSFEKAWIAKAREDRGKAGADTVVIVSRTMPNGVAHLSQMEDVWVTGPSTALALITALRQGFVAVERARRAFSMDEARITELKDYLSGPLFRQQVEQVVSLAAELDKGLLRERTQHERTWKESHAAFERILSAAIGIWTDLEIHSGQGLSPSEVMKPFLKAENVEESKRKGRSRRAA